MSDMDDQNGDSQQGEWGGYTTWAVFAQAAVTGEPPDTSVVFYKP